MADHVDALLAELNVPPPYVLVGHSWGGALILHYAGHRGRDVVGMVYLDPMDPWDTAMGYWLAADDEELAERSGWALESVRGENVPPGLRAEVEAGGEFLGTPVERRGLPSDPPVPTAVVLGTIPVEPPPDPPPFATRDFTLRFMERRIDRMAVWVASMSEGTLYMASNAGHFVHVDVPKVATQAVELVLGRVQR